MNYSYIFLLDTLIAEQIIHISHSHFQFIIYTESTSDICLVFVIVTVCNKIHYIHVDILQRICKSMLVDIGSSFDKSH